MQAIIETLPFSRWLQSQMDERGWTQSELARRANLNRAIISKLVNELSQHPEPTTLEALSRAFGMPVEMLYQAAGLLPSVVDDEGSIEEASFWLRKLDPSRREIAIILIKALAA